MVRPCLPDRPVTREHLELPLADLLEIGLEVPPGEERPITRGQLLAERGLDARRCCVKPSIQIHPGEDRFQRVRQDGRLVVTLRFRFATSQTEQLPEPDPSSNPRQGLLAHKPRPELRELALEAPGAACERSEEHTSELQSRLHLVCRLLLEKKKYSPLKSRKQPDR